MQQAGTLYTAQGRGDSVEAAHAATSLGTTLLDMGDYAGAAAQYRRALAIYRRQKGENSKEVGDALGGLGAVAASLGRDMEAKADLRQAIAIKTRVLGPDDVDTLTDKHNLETLYSSRGDYRDAESLIQRCAEPVERHPVPPRATLHQCTALPMQVLRLGCSNGDALIEPLYEGWQEHVSNFNAVDTGKP